MTTFLLVSSALLSLSLGLGLLRVFKGPTVEDRMMSVQLAGTTGVGLILLTGPLLGMEASIDLALVLALLAAVSVAALTRRESAAERHHERD